MTKLIKGKWIWIQTENGKWQIGKFNNYAKASSKNSRDQRKQTQSDLESSTLKEFHLIIDTELVSRQEANFFIDNQRLVCFLKAREYDVAKAFLMWEKWFEWKKDFKPELTTFDDIRNHFFCGKAYWRGHDKLNHPCLYIIPRFHNPNEGGIDEFTRFLVWTVDRGIEYCETNSVSQFCVIYDRRGMTMANLGRQIEEAIYIVTLFQDYYPEILNKVYVLYASTLYWMVWKLVSKVLDKKTKNKIQIMTSNDELLNDFDISQLNHEYGGGDNYNFMNDIKEKYSDIMFNRKVNGMEYYFEESTELLELSKSIDWTKVTIPAGRTHRITIKVTKGNIISWRFRTDSNDISFAVELQLQMNSTTTTTANTPNIITATPVSMTNMTSSTDQVHFVKSLKRCDSHKQIQCGTFDILSCDDGLITLIWDNTNSYIWSKNLFYSTKVNAPQKNHNKI